MAPFEELEFEELEFEELKEMARFPVTVPTVIAALRDEGALVRHETPVFLCCRADGGPGRERAV